MLRIRLQRVLFAGLVAAMLVAPVTFSRAGKTVPQPAGPGIALPLGDCPNPSAGNCP